MRLVLRNLLQALLAAAAIAGWMAAHRAQAGGGFNERRLAFLEAENARLRVALLTRQRADEAAVAVGQRKEIETSIAKIRELPFTKPVTYKEIGRAELPAILRQKLTQQVPEREFADTGVALAALGLLPAGIDLEKTYLDLLGEQIGAFYDQHTQELYTFSGHPLGNAANRVVLAHELTHALQDQHYNLSHLPLEAKGNDDRQLAASALVEGDATLAMNQYMLGDLSAATIKDSLAQAFTTDVRKLVAAPKFMREALMFPYLHGQAFCQVLYENGGWAALAAAYATPPSSTAQILHPEKYYQEREEPVVVELSEDPVLGLKPIAANVLGEFASRELFAEWLHDEARAENTATVWRGDRYLVFGDAKASSYIWRVACRDAAAAETWAAAMRDVLSKRYAGVAAAKRNVSVKVGPDNTVTIIDAQDAHWAKALVERFGPAPEG